LVRPAESLELGQVVGTKPPEYIMRNAGEDEEQAQSRLPGEISITSDMQMTPPLWQKVKGPDATILVF